VYAWGAGDDGQLGLGNCNSVSVRSDPPRALGAASVAAALDWSMIRQLVDSLYYQSVGSH
jgi:hypothetical protein